MAPGARNEDRLNRRTHDEDDLYEPSAKVRALLERIPAFMDEHVHPNERSYYEEAEQLGPWKVYPVVEEPCDECPLTAGKEFSERRLAAGSFWA